MRIFVEAATGLPIILFSAAVVVVVCFWLLVAVGVVAMDGFDEDADLDAWGMGGVPVAVAVSLLTVLAWVFGVGAAALPAVFAPTGTGAWVLRLAVAVRSSHGERPACSCGDCAVSSPTNAGRPGRRRATTPPESGPTRTWALALPHTSTLLCPRTYAMNATDLNARHAARRQER
ncbi:hypothetical protein O1M63_03645 [Streptomyces mirabilis]|nr:hypothetical protein [Streptomyces mirabilis]